MEENEVQTPRITTIRNTIEWPLGRRFEEHPEDRIEFLRKLGASAYDEVGKDITERIIIDDHEVEYNREGEYSLYLIATTDQEVKLNHRIYITLSKQARQPDSHYDSNAIEHPGNKTAKSSGASNSHGKTWLVVLILVVLIIAGAFAVHTKNANKAQQAAQDASTSSRISSLQNENSDLKNQTSQLKDAQSQYQKDQDQQALDNKLNQLQTENNNLRSRLNSQDQSNVDAMNSAIDSIKADPSNGSSVIDQLDDDNGAISYLQQLKDSIQAWLNGKN